MWQTITHHLYTSSHHVTCLLNIHPKHELWWKLPWNQIIQKKQKNKHSVISRIDQLYKNHAQQQYNHSNSHIEHDMSQWSIISIFMFVPVPPFCSCKQRMGKSEQQAQPTVMVSSNQHEADPAPLARSDSICPGQTTPFISLSYLYQLFPGRPLFQALAQWQPHLPDPRHGGNNLFRDGLRQSLTEQCCDTLSAYHRSATAHMFKQKMLLHKQKYQMLNTNHYWLIWEQDTNINTYPITNVWSAYIWTTIM